MNNRAQSETIGIILLVGVVVISVATVGAFALSNIDSDQRDFDATIEVTTDSISIVHAGGDPVAFSDLLIVVQIDGSRTRIQPDASELQVGDSDDLFEPGERWINDTVSYATDDLVTVRLFDAKTQLSKDSQYPKPASNGTSDTTAPSVTVDYPNGGETVSDGDTVTIQWTATDANSGVNSVDLAYSADGGSTWSEITTDTANDGSYDWTVPAVTTNQALVKVTTSDAAGNIGSDTSNGTFSIGGEPPTASLSAPGTTAVGRPTTLDASGSSDPDGGSISEYRWDFDGDGTIDRTTTTATVSHTYWQAGDYGATVTVVDDEGDTASASQTITVNATVRMGVSPDSGTGQTDVDLLGLVDRSPNDALINFSETTVSSYGGSQDADGNYEVADSGRELILRNNTWKKIPYTYEMSSDTVIAVDFRSPHEGEIQGVGLDTDDSISFGRTYNLYGTQNWGITRYSYTTAPDWQRFRITAGQDFTVNAQFLVFPNDDDNSGGDAVTHVRDVMVYEDDTAAYDYAWDVGRDGTTDFTGKQPTRSLAPGTYDVTLTVRYAGNGSIVGAVNRTISIENKAPPVADFEYTPSSPTIDESVTFDASNSTDPDGGPLSYEWDFGDGSPNATGVSPTHSYTTTGNYTVTLTVTDDEDETSTTTKQVEVEPEFVYALNAGGPEQSYDGITYEADEGSNPFQRGSQNTYTTNDPIDNTTMDGLYQSERFGDFSYDVPVQNGHYRVTIELSEMYWNGAGLRLFDVLLEGDRVIDDIDIYERVGQDHALTLTYEVAVTDGTLTADFVTETDNAKLSALRIDRIGPVVGPESLSWSEASDWDDATTTGIFHDGTGGTDPGTLRLGVGSGGPANDSTLVYYPLNGGGDAVDATGNGRDATNDGATTGMPGIGGSTAYEFSNGDELLDDDAEDYLNGLTSFSVSTWVQSDVENTDNGVFFTGSPAGRDDLPGIRYDAGGFSTGGNNLIKYSVSVNGAEVNEETDSGTQTTNWQHLVVTWTSGGDLKLYINGVEAATPMGPQNAAGSISDVTQLLIGKGAKGSPNSGWDGKIDEFRVYDHALNATEAGELHDAASGGEAVTGAKTFHTAVDPESLSLANVSASVPTGTDATVYVQSDPNTDGTFEEESAAVSLSSSGSDYDIDTTGMSESTTYRLRIVFESGDVTVTPSVDGIELRSD